MESDCLMRTVSFWRDGNVLELDSGDDCTTSGMY